MEKIFFVKNGDLTTINNFLQKDWKVKIIQAIGEPLHNGGETTVLSSERIGDIYAYIVLEHD